EQLHKSLQERLPRYMIPSSFVEIPSVPLNANGKVDRRSLPDPLQNRLEASLEYTAPRDAIERELAAIWSETLGVSRVGRDDNFFELGGDSILSIQIVAKANQQGLHLLPRHLFEHQTVAALATVVGSSAPIIAQQGIVTGPAPLTPIQNWF